MLIDTYKGLYNTVGMKAIVTIMVTLLLNILCERGLSVISWIIVFVPFILMTVIVSMLLYVFGLDVASGTINKNPDIANVTVDEKGNIIIYDPYYNPLVNPVYYKRPNVIVPKPISSLQTRTNPQQAQNIFSTSDPAYTS
jgi:hypothetical protein